MKTFVLFLFAMVIWVSTIGLFFLYRPIWLTAVRTGRWLVGNAVARHFPSKYYTFSVCERDISPYRFRLTIVFMPLFLIYTLMLCALVTAALLHVAA